MEIEIKDTESAISEATNITNVATSLKSINTTLGYLIKQIDTNWISSEEGVPDTDKDSIYKSLVSCRDCYANQIIPALDKLGTAIIAYANATDALASQGVSITPAAYVANQGPQYNQELYDRYGGGDALYDGSYTKEEFVKWVENYENKLGTNVIAGGAVSVKDGYAQNMLPYAETFYDEAVSRGLDPTFVFSIACQESGYGSSWNAVNKGNLFGMGAFDSNPSNAFSYSSVESGIADVCENLSTNYLEPNGQWHTGSNISSIGQTYASDSKWADSIKWIMNDIRDYGTKNI